MWSGKKKAITFSFDDCVLEDVRLIALLDKYGLKATFNINSGFFGKEAKRVGFKVDGDGAEVLAHGRRLRKKTLPKIHLKENEVVKIYKNHEVAGHTLTHKKLPNLSNEEIEYEVERDRLNLEKLIGKKVIGFAYPGGGVGPVTDERVIEILKDKTGLKYARTNAQTFSFEMPKDLYALDMTAHFAFIPEIYKLAKEFFEKDFDRPVCLSIWGHSYELDDDYATWEEFEDLLKFLSNRVDVFYGTNSEVFINEEI